MRDLFNYICTKEDVTRSWLLKNGFRQQKPINNEECDLYEYRFPVCKYKGVTTLECVLTFFVQPSGTSEIVIDVIDHNTETKYAPFYNIECGNYDSFLSKIDSKIMKELNKLKIKRRKKKS